MTSLEKLKREASETTARIDAEITRRLLRRARKYGMTTNEGEVIKLVEAWKHAAKKTRYLHHGHKGH